jgi:Ca2+-binding RTX toxin-like protein
MTTLVANQAFDMTQIGTQLQTFFQSSATVTDSQTTTTASYHNDTLQEGIIFTGGNLGTYFNIPGTGAFVPTTGTVDTFELDAPNGILAYKFSDFSLSFSTLGTDLLAGADTLTGSAFNDVLIGAAGIDILTGGRGKDTLVGGTEQDFFNFDKTAESKRGAASRDVISDFSGTAGDGDLIDVKGIDANKGVGGNQKFKFIGTHHFHHRAGELHVKFDTVNDTTIVQGDVNGDAKADFEIQLTGHHVLSSLDFIL